MINTSSSHTAEQGRMSLFYDEVMHIVCYYHNLEIYDGYIKNSPYFFCSFLTHNRKIVSPNKAAAS
ncbi:hypothetical protein KFK09_015982 [Dendrobium nobile]|uniref:Uncharacterized protein n=1 Tax=Dendrobium nobile TaxID=94219 RepID=A0A8T3B7U8_DENNO|nr:hypothetical protein KFK09_015982 [Dendrobium nobile]